MCGFVGIVEKSSIVNTRILTQMTDVIKHRGPDDSGMRLFSFDNQLSIETKPDQLSDGLFNIGLGFRRLSIVELTNLGHQPMISSDGKVSLVFNGEIYNAPYHRYRLINEGYRFNGTSDTEVVLALYILKGLQYLLEVLDGMYSICIVDLSESRIVLIRDHVGIKPLYYYENNSVFLFGSEVKSFFHHPSYDFRVDDSLIPEYLLFRDIADSRTLYKDVNQVPPGHFMIYNKDGSKVLKRYYSLPKWKRKNEVAINETTDFTSLLRQTVADQLLSDVPVGCQLSGGIDSSLISKLSSESGKFNTFSVVVDDENLSEEKYIDFVNSALNISGNKFKFTTDFFVQNFSNATYHLDHPITHPNALGILFLAKNTKPFVTVLLSGEGADEMFGGYERYFYANLKPDFLTKMLRGVNAMGVRTPSFISKLGNFPQKELNYVSLCHSGGNVIKNMNCLPHIDFSDALEKRIDIFCTGDKDFLHRCFDYEFNVFLPSLLNRQDKMTMAHSIENRVPFLGRDFIEKSRSIFTAMDCLNVSSLYNLRGSRTTKTTKIPLKKVSEKYFGSDFTYRAKSGFGFPLLEIIEHPDMKSKYFDSHVNIIYDLTGLTLNEQMKLWKNPSHNMETIYSLIALAEWVDVAQNH
ncbi:MAG: asparagine synthase (glutamine-hydrolyzing) [Bacteroidia bacterium]|nr:asparagine synthase (glutamine-hydrolyzing) [Bacteroidia bacterium]